VLNWSLVIIQMFVTMYDPLRQYQTHNGHCPWTEVYTSHTTFPLLTVLSPSDAWRS